MHQNQQDLKNIKNSDIIYKGYLRDYEEEKIKTIIDLKQEINDNNLLTYNPSFKKYLIASLISQAI